MTWWTFLLSLTIGVFNVESTSWSLDESNVWMTRTAGGIRVFVSSRLNRLSCFRVLWRHEVSPGQLSSSMSFWTLSFEALFRGTFSDCLLNGQCIVMFSDMFHNKAMISSVSLLELLSASYIPSSCSAKRSRSLQRTEWVPSVWFLYSCFSLRLKAGSYYLTFDARWVDVLYFHSFRVNSAIDWY